MSSHDLENSKISFKNTEKTHQILYYSCRFGQRVVPGLTMMVPGRTRRALSIAHVGVQKGPFLVPQKRRIPAQIPPKPSIFDADSVNEWFQV